MVSIFVSSSFDPFYNLAVENLLFSEAVQTGSGAQPLLYLWRNSDVVVIGRFQNPWKECSLGCMEQDGVLLMRRDTGGGAVFHDSQNICFSFIAPFCSNYREKNSVLICAALEQLGFKAEASGRNDITISGAKISGAAYREQNGVYLHHGTLLVGTDLARLATYLNPDPKKLESKGIQSVRARVTNLKTLDPAITTEIVVDALCAEYAKTRQGILASLENVKLDKVRVEYERLASWDWRFGRSPEFTHQLEGHFEWGGIEILLTVKKARIIDVSIYTDALDAQGVEELYTIFKGTVYDARALAGSLQNRATSLENLHPVVAQMLASARTLL